MRPSRGSSKGQQSTTTGRDRLEAVAGDSPLDVAIPFWVTACVRLQPPQRRNGSTVDSAADKVLTAVQVLLADRIKAAGAVSVVLDRTKIARWCGYDSPKKAGWIFDYLSSIGFLRIEQQYVQGRRGRATDTFTVFTQPTAGFVGPRTYAELDRALSDPAFSRTLFVAVTKTRSSGSWSPDGHQDPGLGSHLGTKTQKPAGQGLGSQMGTETNDLGPHLGTKTQKPAGQGLGSQVGTFLQIDQRSSISEREIEERSIEPVPGRAAGPPATGLDEREVTLVRLQLRRLPWQKWAKTNLGTAKYKPGKHDVDQLEDAMCAAMTRDGITLEQAIEVARHAMREAKSLVYLVGAFKPKKLSEWLRRLEAEPLSDDPLPFPGVPASPAPTGKPDGRPGGAERPVLPEWCGACGDGAPEAAIRRNPRLRRIPGGGHGSPLRKCPACHPDEVNGGARP